MLNQVVHIVTTRFKVLNGIFGALTNSVSMSTIVNVTMTVDNKMPLHICLSE
jgi:hypothetical protein